MSGTRVEREALVHKGDPERKVRLKVERPGGAALSCPAVLLMHGFKGFMDWGFFPELSSRLARRGIVAVSMNASGSGIGEDPQAFTEEEAFAKNTYSKELEDMARARAYMEGISGVDPARLGVLGHSRGGGLALLHAAAHGDYRAVVTWAGICDIARMDEATVAAWRERGFLEIPNARTGQVHRLDVEILLDAEANAGDLDILAASRRLSAPTLVAHGTGDEVVGLGESERIVSALQRPTHLVLEGAGHTFGATHPPGEVGAHLEALLAATGDFLEEHL